MYEELLRSIGLSTNEARVYETLLKLGEASVQLVSLKSGVHRRNVYDSLAKLQEKGLVSYVIKEGIRYFEAADPDRILSYVEDQKRELKEIENEAKKLAVDLKKGFDILKPHAEAHVLIGIEGFKTMRRDALRNAKGEHLLLGAISRENDIIGGFFEDWNKKRQRTRIKLRILHKESARGKPMTKKSFMGKYFETRFLPEEIESPAIINIYGDRVVNVLWKKDYPICFLLINKEIADSYRKYFEYLWRVSKP